jgi:uronate dehydrogenase
VPGDPNTILGDIQDFDALRAAMAGVDVVVHLAATSDEAPFLEQLVPNNVVGLYNTYEAARQAGVRRIVFASTCQTMLSYPREATVDVLDPPRPSSMYGATKVFGETLAVGTMTSTVWSSLESALGGFRL